MKLMSSHLLRSVTVQLSSESYVLPCWCSYVMASYARFLWDAEEEEAEEEEEEGGYCGGEDDCTISPKFFEGASHHQPLTAAS